MSLKRSDLIGTFNFGFVSESVEKHDASLKARDFRAACALDVNKNQMWDHGNDPKNFETVTKNLFLQCRRGSIPGI